MSQTQIQISAATPYSRLKWHAANALGQSRCRDYAGHEPDWFCAVTDEGDEFLGISLAGWLVETFEVHPSGYCHRDASTGAILRTALDLAGFLNPDNILTFPSPSPEQPHGTL